MFKKGREENRSSRPVVFLIKRTTIPQQTSGSGSPALSFFPGTASDHQFMHRIQCRNRPAKTQPAAATDLFSKNPMDLEKFLLNAFLQNGPHTNISFHLALG